GRGTDAGGIGVYVEYERNEGRHCAGEIDVLDAPGNLRPGGFAEFELVEDVAGDPVVAIGVPQSVERTAWIVRTRGGQLLMTSLQAECRRNRCKARVERREL